MKIHNHPQKADYANPSEWVKRSAQVHWPNQLNTIIPPTGGVIVPDLTTGLFGNATISHVHVDLTCPDYAEVDQPFTCPFEIKLFHMAGTVDRVYSHHAREIVWDETGNTTPPIMVGDPHGLKSWSGRVTFDPHLGDDLERAPAHGWFGMGLTARVPMASGDQVDCANGRAFFSVIDPTQEERPAHASGRLTTALATPLSGPVNTPFRSRFGVENVEFQDYLPIAPIQTPWSVPAKLYNYSSAMGELTQAQRDANGIVNFPPALFEQRIDLDLHNGDPGILLASETVLNGDDAPTRTIVFDPAALGSGTHKIATIWSQPSAGYTAQVSAILVMDVTVGPGIPPPPPPPPPVPTESWTNAIAQVSNKGGKRLVRPDGTFVVL